MEQYIKASYNSKLIFILFASILLLYSCNSGNKKKDDKSNEDIIPQEEVFLFKGKDRNHSKLPESIFLGKDSIGHYKFPFDIDTMETKQWAYVKDKGVMLAILEDSINLYSDEGFDRLENLIGYQEVDFNPEIMSTNDSFKAELFGDTLEFTIQQVEKLKSSDELWNGVINKENSSFTIYKSDSIYSASFYFEETKYELRKENQNYIIQRVNQEIFTDEEEPLYELDFDDDELEDQGNLQDSNEFIDVLVCYTETTKNASGGTSYVNSEIGLAITETNLSYKNSNVSHRLRLAGTMELKYQETTSSKSDVIWIQKNKEVADRRNQVKADLVVFMVENLSSCGRAYSIQKKISSQFAPYAYCVVKRSCATGYYSFGHEVTHLMGGRHDCKNDSNSTPFDFNHGYEYCSTLSRWRTIMSYSNCGSTRIPYWSNPNVKYNNVLMGNTTTESSCKSNNSELLNRASLTVANFRVKQLVQ